MVWKTIRETDFGVVEDAQYSTLLYSLPASIHVHGVGGTLDPPDMVNMLFFQNMLSIIISCLYIKVVDLPHA